MLLSIFSRFYIYNTRKSLAPISGARLYLEPYKKDLYLGKGLFKYAFLNDSL